METSMHEGTRAKFVHRWRTDAARLLSLLIKDGGMDENKSNMQGTRAE